ncbi:MAG: DivIVA domain-containing protein [Gemmatimonadota bacterium]
MIDLTPLDVRKKKKDFSRQMRGYDPQEVDHFLDMVAERLEEVVKANLTLRERVDRLADRVQGQEGRERAVQEALVTAQSLKHDIQEQARREADLIKREAEAAAQSVRDEIKRIIQERHRELVELNRARSRFLKGFRNLLERELDSLEVEEANPPPDVFDLGDLSIPESVLPSEDESVPFRLSLGGWRNQRPDPDEESESEVDQDEDLSKGDEKTDASLELVPDAEPEGRDGGSEDGDDSDEGRWSDG